VSAPSAVVVGVDLGLKHLALLSTPVAGISDEHGVAANPDHFEHAQRVRGGCIDRRHAAAVPTNAPRSHIEALVTHPSRRLLGYMACRLLL
jgi:hypothetical protein